MVWYSKQRTEVSLATKLDEALSKVDCNQASMDCSTLALIERVEMIRSHLVTTASILGPLTKSITSLSYIAKVLKQISTVILGIRGCAVLGRCSD